MRHCKILAVLAIVGAMSSLAKADYIPYDVSSGLSGNLGLNLTVGMDFDVNSNIVVAWLGSYDSGQDGFSANSNIVVSLYEVTSSTTGNLLTSATMPVGTAAQLIHGSRFVPITPVTLLAGHRYTIVGGAYTSADPFSNAIDSTPGSMTLNNPDGALTFVGTGRYTFTPGAFPSTLDARSPAPYAAGTFIVQSATVPEPGSMVLMGLGLVGMGFARRRLRKSR